MLTLSQAPHAALQASRLGVDQELGGDTARTAGPRGPAGCPLPHGIILGNRNGGVGQGRAVGHKIGYHLDINQLVVSNCVLHDFFSFVIIIIIYQIPSQSMTFYVFSLFSSLLHTTRVER